jgi:hypothetical protein
MGKAHFISPNVTMVTFGSILGFIDLSRKMLESKPASLILMKQVLRFVEVV